MDYEPSELAGWVAGAPLDGKTASAAAVSVRSAPSPASTAAALPGRRRRESTISQQRRTHQSLVQPKSAPVSQITVRRSGSVVLAAPLMIVLVP